MNKKLFQKWDIILIGSVMLAAAVALVFLWPRNKGNIAVVTYNGAVVEEINLLNDGIYHIDADLPVTLEVKGERIRFIHAECPDKICEGYGWIGNAYETAICMPARVAVQIKAPD